MRVSSVAHMFSRGGERLCAIRMFCGDEFAVMCREHDRIGSPQNVLLMDALAVTVAPLMYPSA